MTVLAPYEGETMKYLLLVCADPALELAPEQQAVLASDTESWTEEMDSRGVRLQGSRLQSISDATTVRRRDGDVLVADGPFAETKEYIGGFDVLDCADLDEAIEVAAKHPMAQYGTLEVRPFWKP
jgi:hypothetical protein